MKVSKSCKLPTTGLAFTVLLCMTACEDKAPEQVSPTLGSPTPASPTSGSQVTTNQPTLTVNNATISSGAAPTYSFQVASDAGFTSMVSQASGIAQGSGQTSWQVTTALDPRQYFWRARASVGTTDGPFSSSSDFTISVPSLLSNSGETLVVDPLTNGSSVGTVRGGSFSSSGWRINTLTDFIRYELEPRPALSSGFVEWQNTGLTPRNPGLDAYMLFGMWDPTRGEYRQNDFRVHVQKRDDRHLPPFLRLRWISEGQEIEPRYDKDDWEPSRTYRWRLEWGSEGSANTVRMFLDGEEVMTGSYRRSYAPLVHYIELGINEQRGESVVGAVYSNVRIGRR